MKAVVTGSGGFIGSRLVRRLLERGDDVIGLDVCTGCDICDWGQVERTEGFDVLYHLAAKTFVPDSYENPRDLYRVNLVGTLHTIELCRRNGAKMVFASSYVYGRPRYQPIDEDHPREPFNPYAQSKIMGEDLCAGYHRDFGVPVVVLRPFNIYGPGQDPRFLIPSIVEQARAGLVELKDPEPRRDWVYVDDVVEAYVRAGGLAASGFEVFNLGSGESHSVREVVDLLVRHAGRDVSVRFSGEQRRSEIMDTVADITRAVERIGWRPLVSLGEGLRRVME